MILRAISSSSRFLPLVLTNLPDILFQQIYCRKYQKGTRYSLSIDVISTATSIMGFIILLA